MAGSTGYSRDHIRRLTFGDFTTESDEVVFTSMGRPLSLFSSSTAWPLT